jgi:hypothetical protein
MNRRDFLKGIGAALVSLVLPKTKIVEPDAIGTEFKLIPLNDEELESWPDAIGTEFELGGQDYGGIPVPKEDVQLWLDFFKKGHGCTFDIEIHPEPCEPFGENLYFLRESPPRFGWVDIEGEMWYSKDLGETWERNLEEVSCHYWFIAGNDDSIPS